MALSFLIVALVNRSFNMTVILFMVFDKLIIDKLILLSIIDI